MSKKNYNPIEVTFKKVSKCYSVSEIENIDKKKYSDSWIVRLEFLNNGLIDEVNLELYFPLEFPYKVPKVFLIKSDYERIKYIPHLETDRSICLFQTESLSLPIDEPEIIVLESLSKARRILENGILNKNKDEVFEDEFLAYWENQYEKNDIVDRANFLSLTTELLPSNQLKLLVLKKELKRIKYVLVANDSISQNFIKTLDHFKFEYNDMPNIILGDLGIWKPPFSLSNGSLLDIIRNKFPDKESIFKQTINKHKNVIIIFHKKIGQYYKYFGFQVSKKLILNKNGFRPGDITPFMAVSKFQKNDSLKRYSGQILTPSRIITRTGSEPTKEFSVCIAGLGSIGSSLLYFLSSINITEYNLIDNEILVIENIGRHYLGFSDIRNYKTTSMKNRLLNDKPYINVTEKQESICTTLNEDLDYINRNDLFIVAIGDENIEKLIARKIKDKSITVPTVFLWVEPYLCGGHMVYINPNSPINIDDLYKDRIYKFNVIDSTEYIAQNEKLIMNESGCQSIFTPYSQIEINNFLNSVTREIIGFLNTDSSTSKVYNWIGDLSKITKLGIKVSELGLQYSYGQLIKQYDN